MKTKWISIFIACLITPFLLCAQEFSSADSTGMPGDHFSLEGALELFKKSESPEDFEKLLNTEDNYVNNLDLNEDGEIDYIRVVDNMEDDVHALVLQVPVSEEESQDVAVIEIEKSGPDEAILQIIGDELLYGKQVIVEPYETEADRSGRGPFITLNQIIVNVWFWPSVRFIYGPRYHVWISPYNWHNHPVWWKPWHPHPWRWHYTRRAHYRPHYHVVSVHRVHKAHRVYTPHRKTSRVVHTRTTSRTVVKSNNHVAGKKTTTTTVGKKGKNGAAVGKKTTTTKAGKKGRNGNAAGGKKTTTTTVGKKGKNGAAVSKKTTTTKAGKKGRNGNAAGGKKTTTTVKKKRRKG